MVEPARLALTSTPSIIPSSAEEKVPANAGAACAIAEDQTADAHMNARTALPAASHDIAGRIAPSDGCRTLGHPRLDILAWTSPWASTMNVPDGGFRGAASARRLAWCASPRVVA